MQLLSANNDISEKSDAWTCTEAVDCQQSSTAVIKSEISSSNSLYEINVSLIDNLIIFFTLKKKNIILNHFILFCNQQTIDQIPTDHVRRNLLAMANHSCFDEQKRQCLLQVVSLLNNLEAMSNGDHDFLFDDESFVSITV